MEVGVGHLGDELVVFSWQFQEAGGVVGIVVENDPGALLNSRCSAGSSATAGCGAMGRRRGD
jgi:hypothetical protein